MGRKLIAGARYVVRLIGHRGSSRAYSLDRSSCLHACELTKEYESFKASSKDLGFFF